MSKIFYVPMNINSREKIINECVKVLANGKRFMYITPSREAMFDVRNRLISAYGGLIGTSPVFSFDELEKTIVAGKTEDINILEIDSILIILKELCKKLSSKNKLNIFKNVADKDGFIEEAYRLIKSLKRQDISPEKFTEVYTEVCSRMQDVNLQRKCEDISQIYKLYNQRLKELNLCDIDDISKMAVEMVEHTKIFEDVELFVIDGYINIDKVNKRLFENILQNNSDIDYIVNIPFKNNGNDEFIKSELLEWLENSNFEYDDCSDFEKINIEKDIILLSENLFSQSTGIIGDTHSIKILNAPCIENEVRQTAKIIKTILMNNECDANDIAVFLNDAQEYQNHFLEVFEEFGIPVNMSFKEKVLSQPLVRDIFDLLEFIKDDDSLEKLKNVLSSKFLISQTDIKSREINIYGMNKLIDDCSKGVSLTQGINEIIQSNNFEDCGYTIVEAVFVRDFVSSMAEFKPKAAASVPQHIEFIFDIVSRLSVTSNILDIYKQQLTDFEVFSSNLKTYKCFEEMLSNINHSYESFASDEEVSFYEFLDILREHFKEKVIVKKQADTAGVKVMTPDLARGQRYYCTFILGINEGIYPKLKNSGIFDNSQNDSLYRVGINFSAQSYELTREKIRFNLACASPQSKLYLSYRTSDEDGGLMIKSSFLIDIESLFTVEALKSITQETTFMKNRFDFKPKDICTSKEARKMVVNSLWHNGKEDLTDLYNYSELLKYDFEASFKGIMEGGKAEFSRMIAPEFDEFDGRLNDAQIKQQSQDYIFSESQIKSYLKCPFNYFIERVLNASEFEEDEELSKINIGNIYHMVLKDYYDNNSHIYNFNEDRLDKCINKAFRIINNTKLSELLLNESVSEIQNNLIIFIQSDIEYLRQYELKTGKRLVPAFLEKSFNNVTSFDNAKFKGRIDRVDLEIDSSGNYTGKFVVYDYKRSGVSGFSESIKGGAGFQLAVYYFTIKNILKNVFNIANPVCMGLFYYSVEKRTREGIVVKEYIETLGLGRKLSYLSECNLEPVMLHLKNWIEKLVTQIQSGEFVLPYECNKFWPCKSEAACRFNKYRVMDKI